MTDPLDDVPAPELLEVAQTWWDVDRVPVVRCDHAGRRYRLVDMEDPDLALDLLRVPVPPQDPHAVATALADGLAACDFPPTGTEAAPGRVAATLRAAGLDLTADDA